ncbi:MAG TPA: amidohydrolase family protein [Candidatus Acidoferrales bacterium]|nr:amidohydrolase family protein [Candidatus Acidoferrales bacterium]
MKKTVTALLLCCAFAAAQPRPAVAIRNARIVTVSGPAIAKGTVVVRNGLIEAVGENVLVPADAMVVDGEGLTVYPGLIDGLSTWGQTGAATASTATTAGRGGRGTTTPAPATPNSPGAPAMAPAAEPRARGPEDRPSTTSWLKIADEVSATDRRIETARSAGFTTAATFPTRGIFAGQGAMINLLSGERPGDMVLAPALGQYISVTRAGGGGGGMVGGFPSSLMGYFAYIRQIYLDAAHYQLVKDAYAKDPRGMERPAYDRALEGVLESKRILLPANRLVEIDRMLRFAAELKQPAILYGGRETFRPEAAALLKKYNTPVLLSMHWPEKPRDADPEDVESMRTLATRDQAASAPMVLESAGVKYAFYSDGLDQARDLQRAVKKAIDAGLPRDRALRALTLSPAEIYGVADRLGSIEKGKIGNLVVTRGDIFDDRTKVEMVLVDGRKYTPAPDAAPTGGRGAVTDNPGVNQ